MLQDHIDKLNPYQPNLVFIDTMKKADFNVLPPKEKMKIVLREIEKREADLKKLKEISRGLAEGKNVMIK